MACRLNRGSDLALEECCADGAFKLHTVLLIDILDVFVEVERWALAILR